MSKLKVYRASAGAGKTHTLTHEYLRLALSAPHKYRSVQAVTFTNKATEEMKARIVRELYLITRHGESAKGQHVSPFFDQLCRELELAPQSLVQRARATLREILLDYTSFRISTIDAFFQEVLRAFTRELGLPGGYRVDLDSDAALDLAITAVLADQDSLEESDVAKHWIQEYARSLISDGKGHDLRKYLRRLGKTLLSEQVKQLSLEGRIPSRAQLAELRTELRATMSRYADRVVTLAQRVPALLDKAGIDIDQLSHGRSGGLGLFYKIATRATFDDWFAGGGDPLPKRLQAACDDVATLVKGATGKKPSTTALALAHRLEAIGLSSLLHEYLTLVQTQHALAYSAYIAQDELGSYGLIGDIDRTMKAQQRHAGSMLLADTPSLINRIINDEGGGNFIYEKIGTRIDHQMIDEFQDTSTMQYKDFLPLLDESLASGHTSLVVGDVKQSIYRWRGSDSALLGQHIGRDFGDRAELITLQENWRSTPEIIAFNNALFPALALRLRTAFEAMIAQEAEANPILQTDAVRGLPALFTQYYADVAQLVPESRRGRRGLVAIHRYDSSAPGAMMMSLEEGEEPSAGTDSILLQLPYTLIDLQKRGYRPCDIAILVRKRSQTTIIAQILEQAMLSEELTEGGRYSLEFISSEALQVSRSVAVRFVVAALGYISSPSSTKARHDLLELWRIVQGKAYLEASSHLLLEELSGLGRRSLYETIESIIARYGEHFDEGDQPYLIKLLDLALGYQQDLSVDISDFLRMWQERGALATLQVPEDERKIYLMTVHKSKGLGFPVVLLPFPDWSLERETSLSADYLWCSNPFPPSEVSLLPIRYSSRMLRSLFAPSYIMERVALALDALNLLYVATTRAASELHLWLPTEPQPPSKSSPIDRYTSQLLCAVLEAPDTDIPYQELGEELAPSSDQWPRVEQAQLGATATDRLTVGHLESYDLGQRIDVLRRGLGYFFERHSHEPDTALSPRVYGSLMHHLLGSVETLDQVPEALDMAIKAGLLPEASRAQAIEAVEQLLQTHEARRWFDGSGQVLREVPIIGGQIDTNRRPDRVILYPDGSAVVVDYKFGRIYGKHQEQVRSYMGYLREMGYAPVHGYVWYLTEGIISPVG